MQQPLDLAELTREEKIALVRQATPDSSQPDFEMVVTLAADADAEVSNLAQHTIARMRDRDCNRLLSSPTIPDSVLRYFLDGSRARHALLRTVITHPAAPQDAIEHLAAQAPAGVVAMLLEHLDVLKTGALEALKKNPAAAAFQEPQPPPLPATATGKLTLIRDWTTVAPAQQLQVLVTLAVDEGAAVSSAAREVLKTIDEDRCAELLRAPSLPRIVARYFLDPTHLRPALLPVLLAHPRAPQQAIAELVATADAALLPIILDNLDLLKTPALLALRSNPAYINWQSTPASDGGFVLEVDLLDMLIEEVDTGEEAAPAAPTEGEAEADRGGTFAKIAKMSVAKRVVLALRGNREERGILIRDGSKVVSRAVMGSPKLTDAEVQSFAALKNVSQDVLRLIATNRKFIKDYIVVRNLINNPRLPIDIGLSLLNRLLPADVRAVGANRDVADVVRKMAVKLAHTRKQ